jgi:hypothetical protein
VARQNVRRHIAGGKNQRPQGDGIILLHVHRIE